MEYRIKSPKQGYGRSGLPKRTINWAAECVLDEQVSTELSDVVELGHIFGLKKGVPQFIDYGVGEREGDIQVMPVLSFTSFVIF